MSSLWPSGGRPRKQLSVGTAEILHQRASGSDVSDAAKRRKEERAANARRRTHRVEAEAGMRVLRRVGHPAEATPSSGPGSADAAVAAAAEEVTVRFPRL